MAQLIKTWTFDSTLENWVASGVVSRVTTDGDPGVGCLEGLIYGRNSSGTGQAQWTGSYIDLGIAADAVVNGVSIRAKRKVAYWNVVDFGHWTIGSTLGTLVNQQNESGTTAWAEIVGNTISGLTLDPITSLTLTLSCDLDSGNNASAGVTFRWDTIELIIDYTPNFVSPTITTNAADPIGSTTATLNGNLTSLGDATTVDVYFEWREVGAVTWNSTIKEAKTATGTFNAALTGLDQYTDYEFRAVSEFDVEGILTNTYGSTLTFKTSIYNGALIERIPDGRIIVANSSPHNDTVDLAISTEYSYQAEVYVNGILQTNYTLAAELDLKTVPASVKLEWGPA